MAGVLFTGVEGWKVGDLQKVVVVKGCRASGVWASVFTESLEGVWVVEGQDKLGM